MSLRGHKLRQIGPSFPQTENPVTIRAKTVCPYAVQVA